jgi:hypothetical protein
VGIMAVRTVAVPQHVKNKKNTSCALWAVDREFEYIEDPLETAARGLPGDARGMPGGCPGMPWGAPGPGAAPGAAGDTFP